MNLPFTDRKSAIQAIVSLILASSAFGQYVNWGGNSHGQLGREQMPRHASPIQVIQTGVLAGKTISSIAPGGRHTLALDSNGVVYSWGGNRYGQLGSGTYEPSVTPIAVTGGSLAGKTIVAISAGGDISVALDSTGVVHTWGAGGSGALGRGSSSDSLLPQAVAHGVLSGVSVSQIACGDAYVLALASDNTLAAWGSNITGQLGDGSTSTRNVPTAVDVSGALTGLTIQSIACGHGQSFALSSSGLLYAWGSNTLGQLGDGSTTQRNSPVAVNSSGALSGKTVIKVASGSAQTVALTSDGLLYCWGLGSMVGNGTTAGTVTSPVAVTMSGALNGLTPVEISASHFGCMVLTSNGTLVAWGTDQYGAAGNGKPDEPAYLPVLVDTSGLLQGKTVTLLSRPGGWGSFFCVTTDGVLCGWGRNTESQLGTGVAAWSHTPFARPLHLAHGRVIKVAVGMNHTLMFTDEDELVVAGSNEEGQLGIPAGSIPDGETHLQRAEHLALTGTLTTSQIASIAAGHYHSVAVTKSGAVYAWGRNSRGQTGRGNTSAALHNAGQVVSSGALAGKTIVSAAAGADHTVVLASDGTLYAWGGNTYGQLGDGTTTSTNVPVAVNMSGHLAGKIVTSIACGAFHSAAVTQDGKAYVWGYGGAGSMGNGATVINNPLPLPVSSAAINSLTITQVAAGHYHMMVVSSTGRVFAWGTNSRGQLGTGNTTTSLSPTEITGSGGLSGKTVQGVTCGEDFTIFATTDHRVASTGAGHYGSLGNGSYSFLTSPALLPATEALASMDILALGACGSSVIIGISDEPPDIAVYDPQGIEKTSTGSHHLGEVIPQGTKDATFTIRNEGGRSLTGIAASLTGTSTGFSIIQTPATTLISGAETTLGVRFTSPYTSVPSTLASSHTLRITCNDPNESPFELTLSATTVKPTIFTQHPVNQRRLEGQTVSFSCVVDGYAPMTYQWRKDGINLTGKSGTVIGSGQITLELASPTSANQGFYDVVVSNEATSKTSDHAHLSIGPANFITTEPEDLVRPFGAAASVSVITAGSGLTFQWYRSSGSPVAGANTATLNFPSFAAQHLGSYYVVVSDGMVQEVSRTVSIEEGALPSIQPLPSTVTINSGQTFTLTPVVGGMGPFTHTWSKNEDPLPNPLNNPVLSIANCDESHAGDYRLEVVGALGVATSNITTLHVRQRISIVTPPAGGAFNNGQMVTLSVLAQGDATQGPINYLWKRGGSTVQNSNSPSYQFTASTSTTGSYTVLVTNAFSQATSTPVTISLNQPPSFTTHPQNTMIGLGGSGVLECSVTGTGPFSYQWRKSGQSLQGETGPRLHITSAEAGDGGSYDVVVTNIAGSAPSNPATVQIINGNPVILEQPRHRLVQQGAAASFSVRAVGREPLKFQWYKNGAPIRGANQSTYLMPVTSGSSVGSYSVSVTADTTVRSGVAELGVIPGNTLDIFVPYMDEFALFATALGRGLSYRWYESDQNGVFSTSGINHDYSDPEQVMFGAARTPHYTARFKCLVSNDAGDALFTPEIRLFAIDGAPDILAQSLPPVIVGSDYNYQVQVDPRSGSTPQLFVAQGLPPGLKIDRKTGRIHGTVKTMRSRPYDVRISAINLAGHDTFEYTLGLEAFPDGLAGKFEMLIPRSINVNGDHGGILRLNSTRTGGYTGTLQLGARKFSLSGVFAVDQNTGNATSNAKLKPANLPGLPTLVLNGNSATSTILATISDGVDSIQVDAKKPEWSTSTPATAHTGYYTAGCSPAQTQVPLSPLPPEGSGYLTVKVSPTGSVTLSGKAGDGSAISGAGLLGPAGQIHLHQMLHAGSSSLQIAAVVAAGLLDGNGTWLKLPQPSFSVNYTSGFPLHALQVSGGIYTPPSAGQLFAGAGPGLSPNLRVFVPESGGRLISMTLRPGRPPVFEDTSGKPQFTFSPATGTYGGSVRYAEFLAPVRVTRCFGVVVQRHQGSLGCIIKPVPPDDYTPASRTPVRSVPSILQATN